jgi:hypothetical protein
MVEAILNQTKTQTRRVKGLDVINNNPNWWRYDGFDKEINIHFFEALSHQLEPLEQYKEIKCPYGEIGDVLWVKETWKLLGQNHLEEYNVMFKDGTINEVDYDDDEPWIERLEKLLDVMAKKGKVDADEENERYTWHQDDVPWKPSIHMPKDAGRIFLQITDIRIERLQDITEDDAKAEGIEEIHPAPFLIRYKNYFNPSNHHSLPETWENPYHSFQSLWESINGSDSWELNPFVWVVEFKQIA